MNKFNEAIKQIEDDHEKLLAGLQKLEGCSIPERLDISRFLVGYLTSHMFLEEYMMQLIDYPLQEEHKLDHRRVQDEYIIQLREFIKGSDNDLISRCKILFEQHAQREDTFLMEELHRLKDSIDAL